MMAMGRKGGPRDTRPIDPMTGRIVTPEKPANADQSNDSKGEEDGEDGGVRVSRIFVSTWTSPKKTVWSCTIA
ncbi:hypothetical protein CMV_019961 [Castanea mollissima]|uniref:Uncharacterized protein n=1 Tax=Castanea mollissima TaxID=60419 RepID=A0A8J4QXF1_9ROSI|nr:hypothetical protein CMV_019961 [Castanea mollissima]